MEIAFEELILTGRLKFGCRFCFLARENKTKTEKEKWKTQNNNGNSITDVHNILRPH